MYGALVISDGKLLELNQIYLDISFRYDWSFMSPTNPSSACKNSKTIRQKYLFNDSLYRLYNKLHFILHIKVISIAYFDFYTRRFRRGLHRNMNAKIFVQYRTSCLRKCSIKRMFPYLGQKQDDVLPARRKIFRFGTHC